MKNKVLKVIRFTSLLLVILLFLPSFSLWAVEAPAAEVQGTVPEGVTVVSEDESKRTAFEKHYLLSDGTYYAVSYAEAVHEQDEQGNWVDVDAAPAYDSKDSSYKVKGKQYSADFDTAEGKASLVNKKGQALTWHYELIGASDEKAVMKLEKKNAKAQSGKNASPKGKKVSDQNAFELPQSKGELLFEDAFGTFHAEVRYTVSPQKIKEDVILYEKGAVYALCMVVENCDYKARLENNAVIFEDSKGNDYFYIDAPLMYDAAGASSTDVPVLLKQTGKTVTVTYTPNKEWLNSNERVYPVTFDPAVTTEDYESNMEDGYLLNNENACYTTNNRLYVGKVSGVEAQSVILVNKLPETGTLPIIQASLYLPTYSAASSYVNGKTLILEQVSYKVEDLSSLQFSTDADSVSQVGSTTVATGDTSYTFNVLTSGFLENKESRKAVCYRLRFSSVSSGGTLQLGSLEQSSESKRPVLTVCYGYQMPSFTEQQLFLNNAFLGSTNSMSLTMNGTTLSMTSETEAKSVMIFQEAQNGVVIKAHDEENYLDAANGTEDYPVAGSPVSGSTAGDEWVIVRVASGQHLILLATNLNLALTRSSEGITLEEVSSNLVTSQYWIFTDLSGTELSDAQIISDDIYYLNNLSSRTFMIMNSATATTPILKAGTESALGEKMAWNIRYIGGGYYMIESVYAPRYYLTVSSSGVAMEFLNTESVPNKAKFTIQQNGSEYLIKSGTNHYLAKSSSADTIGTATSALERAKWRMCLESEYVELEDFTVSDFHVLLGESYTLSIKDISTGADFADEMADFKCISSGNAYSVSEFTITSEVTTSADVVSLTFQHIPTGITEKCTGWFGDGIFCLNSSEGRLSATITVNNETNKNELSIEVTDPAHYSVGMFDSQPWYTEFAVVEEDVPYYYLHSLHVRDENGGDNNVLSCSSNGDISLSMRSNNNDKQLWQFNKTSSGTYQLINKGTSKKLYISDGKVTANKVDATAWDFEDIGELNLPECHWKGSYNNVLSPIHIKITLDESMLEHEVYSTLCSPNSSVWDVWNGISSKIVIHPPEDQNVPSNAFEVVFTVGDVEYGNNAKTIGTPVSDDTSTYDSQENWQHCTITVVATISDEQLARKVLIHELGHALKLSHVEDEVYTIGGQSVNRAGYNTRNSVLSIMNQGDIDDLSFCTTINPTFLDKVNLIRKWGA